MTSTLLIAIVLLPGWIYLLAAALAIMRFIRQPEPSAPVQPPVSILKPLHGDEPGLYDNLRSFAAQDYPTRQIVLGVGDSRDCALGAARRLVSDFPDGEVALVIDEHIHGSNHKVSNLANMLPAARHNLLVLADSDMRVDRRYLAAVTAPFGDARVGLVTCLYKGVSTGGIWSELGALNINFGFLPGAVIGNLLGWGRGCFGATIALRRTTLARIGGFARFRNELADDYRLGEAVCAEGLRVVVSRYVVEAQVSEGSFAALWRHELRWARTTRGLAPWGYVGSVVTHPLVLAFFAAILCEFSSTSLAFLAFSVLLRWASVVITARVLGLRAPKPWLLPARDGLSFAVFIASFFGRKVFWRDQNFHVEPSGRMTVDGDKVR
jgi:ceramide glucosyltransferase